MWEGQINSYVHINIYVEEKSFSDVFYTTMYLQDGNIILSLVLLG